MTNKSRPPGRRSPAEAERTRKRILRAAERLFARRGFQGVSVRDLAEACGVQMFTVQHHFGSKLGLYRQILRGWDREIQGLLQRVLAEEESSSTRLVERIVEELFDLYLANRERVAIAARAAIGEGLSLGDRSWLGFMNSTMAARKIGSRGLDTRLLLVTVEGILNHHALSAGRYRRLFGRDVTDPPVARRTKTHLQQVVLAILGESKE